MEIANCQGGESTWVFYTAVQLSLFLNLIQFISGEIGQDLLGIYFPALYLWYKTVVFVNNYNVCVVETGHNDLLRNKYLNRRDVWHFCMSDFWKALVHEEIKGDQWFLLSEKSR